MGHAGAEEHRCDTQAEGNKPRHWEGRVPAGWLGRSFISTGRRAMHEPAHMARLHATTPQPVPLISGALAPPCTARASALHSPEDSIVVCVLPVPQLHTLRSRLRPQPLKLLCRVGAAEVAGRRPGQPGAVPQPRGATPHLQARRRCQGMRYWLLNGACSAWYRAAPRSAGLYGALGRQHGDPAVGCRTGGSELQHSQTGRAQGTTHRPPSTTTALSSPFSSPMCPPR